MSSDRYGFSPTFEIDPYEDPRLDSLGNPIVTIANGPPYDIDTPLTVNGKLVIPPYDLTPTAPAAMLVQGKMLTASLKMSPYEAEQMDDLEMKNRLITLMVREIMDNKCIEFTKQQDYANDEVIIRARIYVTPDDDVKVIRQMQK